MRKAIPLIIFALIISILLVSGCLEQIKEPLTPEEQKLIGTWSIKTQAFDLSYTFNSDKTGIFKSEIRGNVYFKWSISNGYLYGDSHVFTDQVSQRVKYGLTNNDKILILPTDVDDMYFEKSWW